VESPGESPQRHGREVARVLALVWESAPVATVAAVALTVVQGVLPLLNLYLVKLVIDGVVAAVTAADRSEAYADVLALVLLSALVALLTEACWGLTRFVREVLTDRVTDRVYELIHAKACAVDLESYERPDFYDALHRAHKEASFRPTQMLYGMLSVGQGFLSILALGAWLFTVDWRVGVGLLLSVLPALWARVRHARRSHAWTTSMTPVYRRADYYDWLVTDASAAKEIRLFGIGDLFRLRFSDARRGIRRGRRRLASLRCVQGVLSDAVAVLAVFASYAWVVYRAVWGSITVGELAMFHQSWVRIQLALRDLITHGSLVHEDRLFVSSLFRFLDMSVKVRSPAVPSEMPRPLRQGLEVRDVSFRYPGAARDALTDVSIDLRPGEVIAIVGANGSGKTTLVKLLCRLYDPQAGAIRLDGRSVREFDLDDLRRTIAVVLQDHGRYCLSARESIWLGDVRQPQTSGRILESARRAGLDSVLGALPGGLETVLGKRLEEGAELSAGEWQRFALARSFFRDAQILVLDEPTSSMDAMAEYKLFLGFKERLGDAAAILISHRLSTVRMADRIYVLEEGRVTESGTHAELLRSGAFYARLYEVQARPYREEGLAASTDETVAR
jgi:ATP-binding cassette subfamily B protein